MPTYEYECEKCGHRFEARQKMADKPLERCPECGGAVRRIISAGAGVIFKGSGFYATDYRSAGYKKRQKEEEGKPPGGAGCENAGSQDKCRGCPKSGPQK